MVSQCRYKLPLRWVVCRDDGLHRELCNIKVGPACLLPVTLPLFVLEVLFVDIYFLITMSKEWPILILRGAFDILEYRPVVFAEETVSRKIIQVRHRSRSAHEVTFSVFVAFKLNSAKQCY